MAPRHYTAISAAFMGSLLLSCFPTPEEPLPPRLGAPALQTLEIGAVRVGDSYREAVRLRWEPPATDSSAVHRYSIIRKDPGDSVFKLVAFDIPDTVTVYDDVIAEVPRVSDGYTSILYRVFAIDASELLRSSDTSAVREVQLAQPPLLEPVDTFTNDTRFRWAVPGIQVGYYSYAMVWDADGVIWQSPRPPNPSYGADGELIRFSVEPADSLRSLAPGRYHWAIQVDVIGGDPDIATGAIAIGSFHVP
jgi:hypothetical protein